MKYNLNEIKEGEVLKLNKKGFTLIEVMISLAIISIISVSFFSVFTNSFMYTIKSKQKLEAINLAQNYIEEIKVCNCENVYNLYSNKNFDEGDYIVSTNLEKAKFKNTIKVIVSVKKNDDNIVTLETYKKLAI